MSPLPPPVKLSVLRDIGWREWDPIELGGADGDWAGSDAADEYDRYLLHATARLQKGELDDLIIDFLVETETDHMGVDWRTDARLRATATVAALREYVTDIA
jgi:hypothetical protein